MKTESKATVWISGIIGALLTIAFGWKWNMMIAPWLAFPLLMRFFRSQDRWYKAMPIIVLIIAMHFLTLHGGWDMEISVEIAFSTLVSMLIVTALYFDRYLSKKIRNTLVSSLVFPTVFTALDYLLVFSPVGTTMSLPGTQIDFLPLIQIASVAGLWSIAFLVCWFASIINVIWENGFNLRQQTRTVAIFTAVILSVVMFGSIKTAFFRPASETVKIASISAKEEIDYWSITDIGTPKKDAPKYVDGMEAIKNELFSQSQRAADYGSKIIFWSEGNCPMYEDTFEDFMTAAKAFAIKNKVYFAPSILILRYGKFKNDNKVVMINPQGEVEYIYEKTYSWYPTDSDGIIHTVETPYGTIASVICFDLDFPAFIRQAYQKNVDILLVPGYDTERTSPYHTQEGIFRGIEYGMNIVRHANKSTSIASDYNGNVLNYQNFFNTDDHLMISDVPVKKIRTFYGMTCDWFVWSALPGFAVYIGMIASYIFRRKKLNIAKSIDSI